MNEYTSSTGMISSPRFGGQYPSNANCSYYITLPESQKVFLKFSMFELEDQAVEDIAAMPGQDCPDLLEVRTACLYIASFVKIKMKGLCVQF
jgi:hypothetical protein